MRSAAGEPRTHPNSTRHARRHTTRGEGKHDKPLHQVFRNQPLWARLCGSCCDDFCISSTNRRTVRPRMFTHTSTNNGSWLRWSKGKGQRSNTFLYTFLFVLFWAGFFFPRTDQDPNVQSGFPVPKSSHWVAVASAFMKVPLDCQLS